MAATRDVAGVAGAKDAFTLGVAGVCDIQQSVKVPEVKQRGKWRVNERIMAVARCNFLVPDCPKEGANTIKSACHGQSLLSVDFAR